MRLESVLPRYLSAPDPGISCSPCRARQPRRRPRRGLLFQQDSPASCSWEFRVVFALEVAVRRACARLGKGRLHRCDPDGGETGSVGHPWAEAIDCKLASLQLIGDGASEQGAGVRKIARCPTARSNPVAIAWI